MSSNDKRGNPLLISGKSEIVEEDSREKWMNEMKRTFNKMQILVDLRWTLC